MTVTVMVVTVAQSPAVGVKVYVPEAILLTAAGFQVPVIPLFEVNGRPGAAAPKQISCGSVNVGTTLGDTVTSICVLALSQDKTDWDTHQLMVRGLAVDGVGAVGLPVPPLAVLYQRRLLPVAVRAAAGVPWQ